MEDADLIAVPEAAVAYGLSRDTIYRVIRAHELPLFKRRGDRRTFLRRADLEQALATRAKPGRPPKQRV